MYSLIKLLIQMSTDYLFCNLYITLSPLHHYHYACFFKMCIFISNIFTTIITNIFIITNTVMTFIMTNIKIKIIIVIIVNNNLINVMTNISSWSSTLKVTNYLTYPQTIHPYLFLCKSYLFLHHPLHFFFLVSKL